MQFTRLYPRRSGLAVAGLAAAMIIALGVSPASATDPPGPAAAGRVAAGPTVKLEATSPSVTVDTSFQGYVIMDPGIWVASLGSALQFNVQRPSYTKPVTITQILYLPGGRVTARPLPDRKSTRLNSSHVAISYAVFCLKKKKKQKNKMKIKSKKKKKKKK